MTDFLKMPDTLGAWKRQLAFFESIRGSAARISVTELIETRRTTGPVKTGGA